MSTCGIYKIQNKQNGRVYIGKSIQIEERFRQHKQSCKFRIDKAIQDLGEDNFIFEIIETCCPADLNNREIYWIKFYDSYEGDGYNDTPGGESTEAMLKVIRQPVEQYFLDGQLLNTYASGQEASRQTGITQQSISCCCNSHPRYEHAGGFQWKYVNSNKIITPILTKVHSTKKKELLQLDKTTNPVIAKFPSAMEAERQTKINHRHISECCKGSRKTAGGFMWKYSTSLEI